MSARARPLIVHGFDPLPQQVPQTPAGAPVTHGRSLVPAGLLDCTGCPARAEAMRVVPGEGPLTARMLFLGQNPGEDEDLSGRPFIGRAGEEFDRWLGVLGIDRARVFVTNVVKCHTFQNRVPRTSEIQTCSNQWLVEELRALTDVEVVVPLGKPAVDRILGKSAPPMLPPMVHHFRLRMLGREMSVFPLPHPAFLLRAQHYVPLFMETLLPQVRETLQQELPAVYDASRKV